MKVLDFKFPQITSYGGIANTLGILEAHPETFPWIYSNFIQMIYYENVNDDYLHNMTGSLYELEVGIKYLPLYAYCPFFYTRSLNKEIFFLNEDIISAIIKLLDANYYFLCWINYYDIQQSEKYHNMNFEDGIVIYGYDLDQKEFYCAGFIDGYYKQFKASFRDIKDAMMHEVEENLYSKNISLIKYDTEYKYSFSLDTLCQNISDYLSSCDSKKKFSFIDDKKYWYGIAYYDKVMEQFQSRYKDMRLIHNLVDHKMIMSSRIDYLRSIHIINEKAYDSLSQLNENLYHKLLSFRNMTIKNNMRHKDMWPKVEIDSAIAQLDKLKKQDTLFFEQLLTSLNTK